MKSWLKRLFSLVCAIAVVLSGFVVNAGSSEENGINRFNVVLVLDASGSLRDTDPDKYREAALEQFIFLLADTGNYLGCVVFDTDNRFERDITVVNSQEEKASILEDLKNNDYPNGGTNIGGALKSAVEMITDGDGVDPNLPSVIVFVSDGETDMPKNRMEESLDDKASAIELARNNGIMIYSVCLKANEDADTSEMHQISDATNGKCIEVDSAEKLQEVLSVFYSLIYKTTPIPFDNELEFDSTGIILQPFDIPGLGVEEANFIVYGHVNKEDFGTDAIKILDPSGAAYPIPESDISISDNYAMIKWKNPVPDKCLVEVHGKPGAKITGNMVYNVNLFMSGNSDLQQMTGSDKIPVNFSLQLGTGNKLATKPIEYSGFSADLIISDAYQREIESIPMTLNDDGSGFSVPKQFTAGSYFYSFRVTGFSLDKRSELYGPFTIVHSEEEKPAAIPTPPPNTSPVPVQDEVSYKKYVIPFLDNTLTIPVSGLATDAEDSNLYYQLESTSFVDGKDYTFDGDKITMTNYSLSKGDYIIKATDTGGLSCKIKIKVQAINVGLIALITVCSIAFLVIAAALLSLWYWKLRRLKGILSVTDASNIEKTTQGGVGQIRLSRLAGNCAGFDPKKSYIQCTGMGYVFFISNKKFKAKSRDLVKKVKIAGNGNPVTVNLPDSDASLTFKFQATVRQGRGGGRGGRGGAGRGGAGGGRGVRVGAGGGRAAGGGAPGRSGRGSSRPVRSSPGRSAGGRGGLRR